MLDVLPGLNCADLIAQKKLNVYAADGSVTAADNAQAGWDKIDRMQREGTAKIAADNAARESANADKSMLRKAAFEKCKPLINSDNSKMEAFKACYNNAIK